ncbi:MAG TPA: BREX system ATP-binding domain-containing protein [Polyangiaceae bacterium]|nr:BREX system ATP-binding domain-containing protein [Polyangiaceae bacterium]
MDAAPITPRARPHALLALSLQALEDLALSGASEVVFVRSPTEDVGALWFDALESAALRAGFAVARVGLMTDRAFDQLDALVRSVARNLRAPGAQGVDLGVPGLVSLLDAFYGRWGEGHAEDAFTEAAAREFAAGDLSDLCRAYLGASNPAATTRARRELEAWLSGASLERAGDGTVVLGTLGPVTARRALSELTRLVRALGARGTLMLFENAHLFARLTDVRRDGVYTVLRELIDNADGARGLASTRAMLLGLDELYQGRTSIASSPPLATRVLPTAASAAEGLPPPHHPYVDLEASPGSPPPVVRAPREAPAGEVAPLVGALVRSSFGVPPVEPLVSTTVGYERIDSIITSLFAHSDVDGSVFTLVTGAYGAGKTHLISHLTARALADRRPVLRLSLERLDIDLGIPQRHLHRMLSQSTLPGEGRLNPLDVLERWSRDPAERARIADALARIAASSGPAAHAATRLLRRLEKTRRPALTLERFLGALELVDKPLNANYRQDAYGRLLLWLALLEEVEGCSGPVLVVDEAENLYRPGVTRAERRTALRSLAFYCSGALPRACVVLAVTPEALSRLRDEVGSLLDEVDLQRTLLPWEDASMLRRRLTLSRALDVPALDPDQLSDLARRWRLAHATVRGDTSDPGWAEFVEQAAKSGAGARALVRAVLERLERAYWTPPHDAAD